MPKKISNHLHELIHSLSGTEKRYFKKFASRHASKDKTAYFKLFEAIEKQSDYDEEKIIDKLFHAKSKSAFSLSKNRLYHQILKSLDSFHAESSVESELYYYLHYAEILFNKALYEHCRRILSSAEKIANKNEKWIILLQIIRQQKRLAELNNYESTGGDDILELTNRELEILKHLSDESKLWQRKSAVFARLFKNGQIRKPEDENLVKAEIEEIKKLSNAETSSFESSYLSLHTQSAFYFSTGDYTKCFQVLKRNIELMELRMELVKNDPTIYISALTNIIYISAKLNQFDEVNGYLNKSRNLPGKLRRSITTDLELRIFTSIYSLELAICILTGNINRGIEAVHEVEKGLAKWKAQLSDVRKAGFYHNISTIYILNNDFKKALSWNNKLLNTIPIDHSEDQYCFAKIMHILIQYELGNYDAIPHNLKSLKRQLKLRKRKQAFEDEFIELMLAVSKTPDDQSHTSIFTVFADRMKSMENDPLNKIAFEYFDFKSWADAKILGKPLALLVRQRAPEKDIL